jgi:DNA-binding CsgD family transcriptional regulator
VPDASPGAHALGGGHAGTQGANGRAVPRANGTKLRALTPRTNGHGANGHGANGHGANGHDANGHDANGHGANGHGANGQGASAIVRANHAGRRRLELSPDLDASLGELVRGHPVDGVDVTVLTAPGVADHLFVVVREAPQAIVDRLALATTVWTLTPRQRQVLEMIVRGEPTKAIAAELGCSKRAVELHVTALLDRSGVDSRSALVTTFWTLW